MNELLRDASIADIYARLEVQSAVLKAVVMAHPFPLQIDQSLKEVFPKLLDDLRESYPKVPGVPGMPDFAEVEVDDWRATLHARLNTLSHPKAK